MGVDWESFCEEISKVVGATAPQDAKLLLGDTVAYPVETHIAGLRALQLHTIVGNPHGARVVAEDDGGGLGIAESHEDGAQPNTCLSVDEHSTVLGFGGGSHNDIKVAAGAVDGAVDVGGLVTIAQAEVATNDRAGLGAREVGRI